MNNKGIGVGILLLFSMLAFSQVNGVEHSFQELNGEKMNHYSTAVECKPLSTGRAFLGIIMINSSEVTGLPEIGYMGILADVNAQFSNYTEFMLVSLFVPTFFQTNQTMNVRIDLFWGSVEKEQDNVILLGFVKGINWEW